MLPEECLQKIESDFVIKTLAPYSNKGTIYLQEASVSSWGKIKSDSNYIIQGIFSIKSPCYVENTGHFNAVEFVICYNQIGAVSLAYATKEKLLLCLQDMTVEQFYTLYMSGTYITRLDSKYKGLIDPNKFFCKFEVIKERKRSRLSILKTFVEFSDAQGGFASGEIDLAIQHL